MNTPDLMPRSGKAYGYIRYSKEEQKKGASVARQKAGIEKFAQERGLTPVDVATYRDLGVSAYSGANVAQGSALARFLADIEDGKVGKGDWLIVENLDRLSRRTVEETFQLLFRVTGAGVTVATVQDGSVFQKGKFDLTAVMRAAIAADLAFKESAKKSERVCDAWARKRAAIGTSKLTAKCPGWLKLSSDKTTFEIINDRAALVRRIFQMTKDGKGSDLICREFNQEGKKAFRSLTGWNGTTVSDILRSRAVIGEFVPCKMVNGKRQPAGEPIKDYFPRIISDADFYSVQKALEKRKGVGGRAISSCANLFTGIAVCTGCGGPVHLVRKNPTAPQLRCDRTARRVENCRPYYITYPKVETAFLKWLVDFDFSGATQSEKRVKEADLTAAQAEAEQAQRKIARLTEAMTLSEDLVSTFIPQIQAAKKEENEAKARAAHLAADLANMKEKAFSGDVLKMARVADNRFRLREEIRRRFRKLAIDFAQKVLYVELADGGVQSILLFKEYSMKNLSIDADGKAHSHREKR